MDNREKKIKATSYELIDVCVEKGLIITEMFELARIFPNIVKSKISEMEQKVGFTDLFFDVK